MRGLKLKISAGAVIVNAMMALTLIGSSPARAQSCAPQILGCTHASLCSTPYALQACQGSAAPGCTAVSAQCSGSCENPPLATLVRLGCYYQ